MVQVAVTIVFSEIALHGIMCDVLDFFYINRRKLHNGASFVQFQNRAGSFSNDCHFIPPEESSPLLHVIISFQ